MMTRPTSASRKAFNARERRGGWTAWTAGGAPGRKWCQATAEPLGIQVDDGGRKSWGIRTMGKEHFVYGD